MSATMASVFVGLIRGEKVSVSKIILNAIKDNQVSSGNKMFMMFPRFLDIMFKVCYPQHNCGEADDKVDLKHMESSVYKTMTRGGVEGKEPKYVPFFPSMLARGRRTFCTRSTS
jgi:hypothetical protein